MAAVAWFQPWFRAVDRTLRPIDLPWGWVAPAACLLIVLAPLLGAWWAPARVLRPLPLLGGGLLLGFAAVALAAAPVLNTLLQGQLGPAVESLAGRLDTWTRLPLVGDQIAGWRDAVLALPSRLIVEQLPGVWWLAAGAALLALAGYRAAMEPARVIVVPPTAPRLPPVAAPLLLPAAAALPAPYTLGRCTAADFAQLHADLDDFWADAIVLRPPDAVWLHELGDNALAVRADDRVVGYLFGCRATTDGHGYVDAVAVRAEHRRRGLARALHARFEALMHAQGCRTLRTALAPEDTAALALHRALGWQPRGTTPADPLPIEADYAGPGQPRIVLEKPLG